MQTDKVSHTPGPWIIEEPGPLQTVPGYTIKSGRSPHVPVSLALVGRGASARGLAEQSANARLIAAAPCLLAACKTVKRWIATCGVVDPNSPEDVEAWDALIAAIAKAEGTD